ncbi:hypothetical protein [Duganella aceris]|uniref:Rho-binding antiterminator n=1 Tax=Duganella aceris TaxID=2703883 RepID=A0ABX0FTB6_9BURK|nr:hypothetical protein [Duganella aceris]NGZ87940.1 hypothetical protein [Duganella aceris]
MNIIHPPYVPISCEFHDRLEDLATLRRPAAVRYVDQGVVLQREAIIKDVFARGGVEYLALDSGELLRLDQLIEVDGSRLDGAHQIGA